ncbi:MAG: NAD(P)H-dependent oxidoreductase [Pyrinomonadaceae bacterium]|nr:NAD(P)H-dependent oxidoreductase [Pyrinomonadaceae bacterium]
MKKILIILGHPNKESFGGSLANSYKEGALKSGAEVKELILADLKFDPILHLGYKKIQELEPDLVHAQKLITWADHLVFVYPLWWAMMPALLKGFIDRTFLPGFAFKYRENSPFWDKYLTGKSARMIVTMDAPTWYNYWINGNAGPKAMKKATLEFSGIKPVKVTTIGQVKTLKAEQIKNWLAKVEKIGETQN